MHRLEFGMNLQFGSPVRRLTADEHLVLGENFFLG